MAIKAAVREVFEQMSARGDCGKDAVKAVRYYARVTGSGPDAVADFALSVAKELEEMAARLGRRL